ncbi:MAG: LptF/LptG family permease [Chthonomonadales bacterium]
MKLVDRLILREISGPFINSVFLFLMLLFSSAYLFKVTDLMVQGVPAFTVAQIALYSLPGLVTQTLPMAMLLSCLLAFGRLSSDSEHIALFASGISFYRIARPIAAMGSVVSLVAIAWNETVVPPATRKYYDLLVSATEHIQATDRPLHYTVNKPGSDAIDEFVSIDGGYDAHTQSLKRVTILKMSDDPKRAGMPEMVVYAQRAVARDPRGVDWILYNGYARYIPRDATGHFQADTVFDVTTTSSLGHNVRVGRPFRGVMQADTHDNHQMTFAQLRDKINLERAQGSPDTLGDEVDLWEKLSLPFASLIFGLVGAPLGVRPQRGSKVMGFGIAIAIIFGYWVVYHWMYLVGKNGGLPPMLASFAADLIGLVAAGYLIARTRQ